MSLVELYLEPSEPQQPEDAGQ